MALQLPLHAFAASLRPLAAQHRSQLAPAVHLELRCSERGLSFHNYSIDQDNEYHPWRFS